MKAKRTYLWIGILLVSIFLCGCSVYEEELIDVDAWKDKLIYADKEVTIQIPNAETIKENIVDMEKILGDPSGMAQIAERLGNGAARLLKQWGSVAFESTAEPTKEGLSEGPANIGAGGRIKVAFLSVVDGDTILVTYEGEDITVRLIGINTPESVHPEEEKNKQEGIKASEFLQEYLADTKEVWLEFDTDLTDEYDRLLAYVWLNREGMDITKDMLNGILLDLGYAKVMTIAPNNRYEDKLKEAAR